MTDTRNAQLSLVESMAAQMELIENRKPDNKELLLTRIWEDISKRLSELGLADQKKVLEMFRNGPYHDLVEARLAFLDDSKIPERSQLIQDLIRARNQARINLENREWFQSRKKLEERLAAAEANLNGAIQREKDMLGNQGALMASIDARKAAEEIARADQASSQLESLTKQLSQMVSK